MLRKPSVPACAGGAAVLLLTLFCAACRHSTPAGQTNPGSESGSAGQPAPTGSVAANEPPITMKEFSDEFSNLALRREHVRAHGIRELRLVEYRTSEGKRSVRSTRRTVYNEAGRPLRVTQSYDGQQAYLVEYEYDGDRLTKTNSVDHRWNTTDTTHHRYDDRGLLVEERSKEQVEKYDYDTEGREIRAERVENAVPNLKMVRKRTYDGEQLAREVIEANGKVMSSTTFTYDDGGRELRRHTEKPGWGYAPVEVVPGYDEAGYLVEIDVHEGGKPLLKRSYEYRDGLLIAEKIESHSEALGETEFAYEYKHTTDAEPATTGLSIRLDIVTTAETRAPLDFVDAKLEFKNNGPNRFKLTRFVTGDGGRIGNDLFEIEGPKGRLPYRGPLKKRAKPGPDGFFDLAPGETVSTSIRLTDYYDFPSTLVEYTAVYRSWNHFSRDDVELRSNRVSFVWPAQ